MAQNNVTGTSDASTSTDTSSDTAAGTDTTMTGTGTDMTATGTGTGGTSTASTDTSASGSGGGTSDTGSTATGTGTGTATGLNSQDQSFLTQTSQGNVSELIGGRLAEQNSGSLATAIFGRQLVTDHDSAALQTDVAALQSGGTVSFTISPTQQAQLTQLASLKGAQFDQQFLSNEVRTNGQSVAQTQQEIASGQDTSVTQLAAVLLPYQQQHLRQAQLLQGSAAGTATAGGNTASGGSGTSAISQTSASSASGSANATANSSGTTAVTSTGTGNTSATSGLTVTPALPLAPNGPLNDQDQLFIQQAHTSNLLEIATGQLAEQQGADPAVQAYGRWMELDHSVADATLQSLAQAGGATVPTPVDIVPITAERLHAASGSAFDQQYLGLAISSHIATVADFQHEALYGSDPALVAFAQSMLPGLEQHLAGALQIAGVLGAGLNDQTGAPSTATGQLIAATADAEAMSLSDATKAIAYAGSDPSLINDLTSSIMGSISGSATAASGSGASTQPLTGYAAGVASPFPASGTTNSMTAALQHQTVA